MTELSTKPQERIKGVIEVRQDRSRRSRDAFINSGLVLLNQVRFNDLKVAEIALHCKRSVGSFYKRFEDKEAFFNALQVETLSRNQAIIQRRLDPARLLALSPKDVLIEVVDTLADIFTSEARGVLRESLLRILEPVDGWAPMRQSGKAIQQRVVDRLKHEYRPLTDAQTERKLRFCYQIVVGVLQNDLVNDFHTFSTKDKSIRIALKTVILDHMDCPSQY